VPHRPDPLADGVTARPLSVTQVSPGCCGYWAARKQRLRIRAMPGPNLPEEEIRSRARQAIEEGRVPVMLATVIIGGHGYGKPCFVCRESITRSQIAYEVLAEGKGLIRFHLTCYAEWQLECAQRTRERDSRG